MRDPSSLDGRIRHLESELAALRAQKNGAERTFEEKSFSDDDNDQIDEAEFQEYCRMIADNKARARRLRRTGLLAAAAFAVGFFLYVK